MRYQRALANRILGRQVVIAIVTAATLVLGILAMVVSAAPVEASPSLTSPPSGPLNDNTGIQSSPVPCGFSDPNSSFTFASGLMGTIEPSDSISLPSGSTSYYYVGSDAGGNPLSNISWSEDLGVVASYSGNESISIGQSTSPTGSFTSGSTTNDAIAGIGVSGYQLVHEYTASNSSYGLSLSLPFTTSTGDLVLVVFGGEGVGLIRQGGVSLSTLVNDTYSECGSDVIASAAMFGGYLPQNSYTATFTTTTYSTNAGTATGAVAYILAPTPTDADLSLAKPSDVTADAAGPSGATVSYPQPTASDPDDAAVPTPTCGPVSGTTFSIGTTTVNCAVSDGDDPNSPVTMSFTVTVKGAVAQLADLYQEVQGVGPGTSLADKVAQTRSELASAHIAEACETLKAFTQEVNAQSGKHIATATASQLITEAQRIEAVLGCQAPASSASHIIAVQNSVSISSSSLATAP